jgi:hypothetical protein
VDDSAFRQKKGWLGVAPSQLISPYTNRPPLVAVVIMLMMFVSSMAAVVVWPPSVIGRPVRWITAVVAVAISRVSVAVARVTVAVTISRITEADPDSSYPD